MDSCSGPRPQSHALDPGHVTLRAFFIIGGLAMANEVFTVTVSGNLLGQFVQNVMHIQSANAGARSAFAQADDIARTLTDTNAFWSTWLSMCCASYRALSLRVRRVDPVHAATVILLAPGGSLGLGTRSGEISSQSNAPVADLFNSVDARRIGKIFIPGISETDIAGGVYTGAYITAFATNWLPYFNATYTTDLGADEFGFGIYAKLKSPKFIFTSDVRLSPLLGTQRRRLRPVA
jgi:hypothetical protein